MQYEIANGSLNGTLIRYNADGKEQHRAILKSGRLESGTIFVNPKYHDTKVLYNIVNKETDKVAVKIIDVENRVVLKAEELLMAISKSHYLNKLDVNFDYLGARDLY